ncbi:C39 family peptidase [Enterococcus sp. LJL51]|uniref:C39 family peptidase n=1 Tax=Enterococcus sp. LJL51 TaxID=3416656 RepID=UPI003CE6B45E
MKKRNRKFWFLGGAVILMIFLIFLGGRILKKESGKSTDATIGSSINEGRPAVSSSSSIEKDDGDRIPSKEISTSEQQSTMSDTSNERKHEYETVLGVEIERKISLPIRQRIQETNYYCVPATVQMLLESFGFDVEQEIVAQQMKTSSVTGTEYIEMV